MLISLQALTITERVRSAEALLRSEQRVREMQKDEAISRLAGGVAHHFNNLLTVVNGYSDLLLGELGDPVHLQFVREIRDAGDQAANLTHQLLTFSRRQMRTPDVLNLNELFERNRSMLSRWLGESIEFAVFLEPALWSVRADSGEVRQM